MSEIINDTTSEATKEFSFSIGLPFQAEGNVIVTVLGNVIISGVFVGAVNGACWCGKKLFGAAKKAITDAKAKAETEKEAEEAPKAEEPEVVNADGTAAK